MVEADTLEVPDQSSFGTGYMPQLPAPAAPGSDIQRDASPLGYDPEKSHRVSGELAGLKRQEMSQQSGVDQRQDARLEQDRARMDRAFRAEGEAKDAVPPPWNADKEREQRMRGPMEQFGSLGSIFAMMASGFTRTPMTTALTAGAAAMTAIQKGDEKAYESAYAAWKDNTALALKRFDMERTMFEDANKLVHTDMQAWAAKRLAIASRYGSQKEILMLENGMAPEILEMDAKKIDIMAKVAKLKHEFEFEYELPRKLIAASNKGAAERATWSGQKETSEQYVARNLAFVELWKRPGSWQKDMVNQAVMRDPSILEDPVRLKELTDSIQRPQGVGAGGNTNLTPDRIRAQDIAKAREKWKAEGKSDAEISKLSAELESELKAKASTMTPYQKQKVDEKQRTLDSIVNQIDRAKQLITNATQRGESVVGVKGLYGRAKEAVLGGGTEQSEFEELIRTIQREVKPIISGTTRLSKEDQKVIDTIVPGLGFFRNKEQALAGLTQLQKILQKKDLLETDESPFVEQNGWIYERQPDGTMKPVKKAK